MTGWLTNYRAAKAAGLIDLWPDPASLGVMQDPKTKAMRLVAGAPAHDTRVKMGLPGGKPDDGHLWDIFHSITDLERAEDGLGLLTLSFQQRVAAVTEKLEKSS